MNKAKRQQIFERLRAANPHPTTELNFDSTFELLIAVILSAQATDKGVNIATAKLFPVANTPEAIYALGEDGLKEYIKTIGLFNSKGANIIKTCRILLEQHAGQVPEDRKALEALPGGVTPFRLYEVLRPISRKYDAAEHEYPKELDMLAALIDGLGSVALGQLPQTVDDPADRVAGGEFGFFVQRQDLAQQRIPDVTLSHPGNKRMRYFERKGS